MNGEKRKNRGYKAKDADYNKAMKQAKKDKVPLATMLEKVIKYYSKGWSIGVFDHSETYASRIKDLPDEA